MLYESNLWAVMRNKYDERHPYFVSANYGRTSDIQSGDDVIAIVANARDAMRMAYANEYDPAVRKSIDRHYRTRY